MGNASARDWDPIIGKRFNPLETVNTHTHTLLDHTRTNMLVFHPPNSAIRNGAWFCLTLRASRWTSSANVVGQVPHTIDICYI